MVIHWSLSDTTPLEVSRNLLNILAALNNALVWMDSTHALNSNSSSTFTNPLVTVPHASIKIGIIVAFMFHCFFSSLTRSRYLALFSLSFNLTLWYDGTTTSTIIMIWSLEFFTSANADGLSLEFKWQQVSPSLQDSS